MATVLIIGDGPAGLSAALLLAKNHQGTVVFGTDTTPPLHHAQLGNYLGVKSMRGSEFQAMARKQVEAAGARTRHEAVREVLQDDNGFIVRSESAEWHGDYVILAAGKASQRLARQLGIAVGEGRLTVDGDQRTTLDRVYPVGRVTRPDAAKRSSRRGPGPRRRSTSCHARQDATSTIGTTRRTTIMTIRTSSRHASCCRRSTRALTPPTTLPP